MDGSAVPWIELIQKAGIIEQAAQREFIKIDDPLVIYMKDDVTFAILPSPQFRATIMIDYKHPALGAQHTTLISLKDFVKDFAPPARFAFFGDRKAARIGTHQRRQARQRGCRPGRRIDNGPYQLHAVLVRLEGPY